MLKEERIAICSQFGCGTIKKVKPLKFGSLGFRRYPKCSKHKLSLVFVDEFIEQFVSSVNSCLFDISSLPSKDLVDCVSKDAPEELKLFINVWMYCSPIGRGAQVVSRYLDGLSKGYIKLLSRKQRKAIQGGKKSKKSYNLLHQGLKKIAEEYTLFLQELRDKSQDYCDPSKVQPLSKTVWGIIKRWRYKQTINERKIAVKIDEYDISILKKKYDDILNLRTASLILGESPREKISAFELFSAYFEFLKEGICSKLKIENIQHILNIQFNTSLSNIKLVFNQINFSESISKNFLERFKLCYDQLELAGIYGHLNTQQDWANLFKLPRSTIGYHLTGNRDKFSIKTYKEVLIMTKRLLGKKISKELDTLYRIEERKLEGYRDLNLKKVIQEELDVILTSALVDTREFRDITPENEVVCIEDETLKGYNFLRKKIIHEHSHDIKYKRLLNHSRKYIEDFYNTAKIMINNVVKNDISKKKQATQKEIGSYLGIREGYIINGEPGFELAKKNREKFLYIFILYKLKCKLPEFFHLLYIGFSSNMEKRLELHILHSLEPSQKLNRTYKEKVYLQKAIRLAIKKDLNKVIDKIAYIDSIDSIFNNKIQTLNDVYNWLDFRKGNWKYRMLIDYIINNVIMKHFDLDILELHKTSDTIRKNEKYYTLNYIHEIGHEGAQETVKGTIWPNGLNSIAGGRGAETYIDVSILDIAAMFTLGFTEIEKITEILIQEYDHINELSAITVGRRIRDVFKSREHALELLLKPVVLNLILDKSNFELKDIITVLDFSRQGMTQYLKDWLNGKTFSLIRNEKRENKYTILELETKYKEPLIQWVSWALKGTNQDIIGKKIGVSRKTIYDIYKKISSILFSEGNLSYEGFKKEFRRKIAIRLLRLGIGHKQIVEETFEMNVTNAVRIFEDCFDLPFNEIMDKYYKK